MKLKAILLAVIAVFILQGELFPRITCRIEGTVEDKDTKEPIAGAVVRMFSTEKPRVVQQEVRTDRNGCFIFKDSYIIPGEYFLQCYKKDYVPFLPDYYRKCLLDDSLKELFKVFTIKEGEIKHIRLKLEKGGTLKGVFLKKTGEGTSNFKNLVFHLEKRGFSQEEISKISACDIHMTALTSSPETAGEGYVDGFFVHITAGGEFTIHGLEPGNDYYFLVKADGYRRKVFSGISIEKGKEETIQPVIDLTDPTGIQGVIQVGGKPPDSGTVYLYPRAENMYQKSCKSILDNQGRYSCLCLDPGRYKLKLYVYWNDGELIKKSIILDIEAGKTKILDFNF